MKAHSQETIGYLAIYQPAGSGLAEIAETKRDHAGLKWDNRTYSVQQEFWALGDNAF